MKSSSRTSRWYYECFNSGSKTGCPHFGRARVRVYNSETGLSKPAAAVRTCRPCDVVGNHCRESSGCFARRDGREGSAADVTANDRNAEAFLDN